MYARAVREFAAERRLNLARPFKAGLNSDETPPRRVSDA